jgi:Ser/Thr protein kinase RdoA (MazF antagonist)
LKEKAIPTTEFYKTLNGEYLWEYKKHVFHLQPYIDGKTYKMNTAPEWLMDNSAIFLGKIHKALMEYPKLEVEFGEKFLNECDVSNFEKSYENMIEESRNIKDEKVKMEMRLILKT